MPPRFDVPVKDIKIPESDRESGDVSDLVESIRAIGLLHPIMLKNDYTLIAGRRRLKALQKIGHRAVPCYVMTYDDFRAELAHLDENLCQKDLTALERAQWLARRKELYEEQHPETKAGRAQGEGMRRKLRLGDLETDSVPRSFVKDTAEKTGRGTMTIKEDVAIGTNLTPAAAEIIKGTPVEDQKGTLLNIAKKAPEKQADAARAAVRNTATRKTPKPKSICKHEWVCSKCGKHR